LLFIYFSCDSGVYGHFTTVKGTILSILSMFWLSICNSHAQALYRVKRVGYAIKMLSCKMVYIGTATNKAHLCNYVNSEFSYHYCKKVRNLWAKVSL